MAIKITSAFGLSLAVGLFLITFGLLLNSEESYAVSQGKQFRQIVASAQEKIKIKEYGELKKDADEWVELSLATENEELKWKSIYNSGTANMGALGQEGDETSYFFPRRNFRDALRQNPRAFEPKLNLTYLENLAKKNGIKLEEIPIGSAETNKDDLGLNDGTGPEGGNEEQQDKSPDLKDKITSGTAPSLGGEPLLDTTSKIDPEDIPEKPVAGY